ncbi:adenylyltransferase/cytidyltransferase family protein [Actinomadura sp. WMMA1423]|uniref:adenylyltransferase/cytidyltransferase family protein n=1 Tax=Actinomadura sp. WMMA1423 TaxID=2591108 RepID=UPI0034A383CF
MIHGRFQPFHLGHYEYALAALALEPKLLLIGITNPWPDSARPDASDSHRHLPQANPYSYVDRARMVQRSLTSARNHIRTTDVLIVPFDIHNEASWSFIPQVTVQLMNLLDPWDEVKERAFLAYGFAVRRVQMHRRASGEAVRALIESGQDVASLVPQGTRSVLEEVHRS